MREILSSFLLKCELKTYIWVKEMCIFRYKRIVTVILTIFVLIIASNNLSAQHRLVEEVKQDLKSQSMTIDKYTSAITKLKPALTNEETKEDAEAWFLAGKASFDKYDKYMSLKAIGSTVDESAMGSTLIEGYDYMQNALKFDTIAERDKNGEIKINKKTGKPKVKTKYSKDIVKIISQHYNDYKYVGRIFYVNSQDFSKSYQAWDIYTSMPKDGRFQNIKNVAPDSVIGEYRFYQGISAKLDGNYKNALETFNKALKLGYNKKDVFDYAINCAEHEKNDSVLIAIVEDAFNLYGKTEPRYLGILFNYSLNNKDYDKAAQLVDKALIDYPDKAEYYDLKGVILEHQTGKIDGSYEYFKKAVELDPNFMKANFDMGRYYYNMALKEEDSEKARELYTHAMPFFEKVYKKEPQNKMAIDALKVIYYNLNDATKLESLGN